MAGLRALIKRLAPGDFVMMLASPKSKTIWGSRPGIMIERFSDNNVTVCPITRTHEDDRIAIGPDPPADEQTSWLCCSRTVLDHFPSYIDLHASTTLGCFTMSPLDNTPNWIQPMFTPDGGDVECLEPRLIELLQSWFCQQRCKHSLDPDIPLDQAAQRLEGFQLGRPRPVSKPGQNGTVGSASFTGGSHSRSFTTNYAERHFIPYTNEEINGMRRTAFCEDEPYDMDAVADCQIQYTVEEINAIRKAAYDDDAPH